MKFSSDLRGPKFPHTNAVCALSRPTKALQYPTPSICHDNHKYQHIAQDPQPRRYGVFTITPQTVLCQSDRNLNNSKKSRNDTQKNVGEANRALLEESWEVRLASIFGGRRWDSMSKVAESDLSNDEDQDYYPDTVI